MSSTPYWRLSGFYFFYFASLGALLPYWSLYLKSLGFTAQVIGTLIAILPATKIFAPYLWGWIADLTRKPLLIIRLANVFTVLAFAGVFYDTSFWWLAMIMLLFSIFWNSSLPLFEAMTLNHLGDEQHRYGGVRLWGSLGFILMVVVLGDVFEVYGIEHVPLVVILLFAGIFFMSMMVPERVGFHHEQQEPIMQVIRQPVVLAFLAVCFLMVLSHGPYYTFYSIYLEDNGYDRRMIGILWAVGVIAEVVIFLLMYRLLPALGVRKLLLIALALTSLRWLLIGAFPQNTAMLFFAQLFHAFSFGLFHAVGISMVHQYFTGKHQSRGQALYSSLSFGGGGAVGSLVSGLLWDRMDPFYLFTMAAAVSALAFVIVWVFITPARHARIS